VAGGTFPAEIFGDFMSSWIELREARRTERSLNRDDADDSDETAPVIPIPEESIPPAEQADPTEPDTDGGGTREDAPADQAPPQDQAPPPEQAPAPAPAPTDPPSGGGEGGGVTPGATE
jgi:hypothetical protein